MVTRGQCQVGFICRFVLSLQLGLPQSWKCLGKPGIKQNYGDETFMEVANGNTVSCVFCYYRECLGEAHEPASCDHWKQWHSKIAEVKPEECK